MFQCITKPSGHVSTYISRNADIPHLEMFFHGHRTQAHLQKISLLFFWFVRNHSSVFLQSCTCHMAPRFTIVSPRHVSTDILEMEDLCITEMSLHGYMPRQFERAYVSTNGGWYYLSFWNSRALSLISLLAAFIFIRHIDVSGGPLKFRYPDEVKVSIICRSNTLHNVPEKYRNTRQLDNITFISLLAF